MVTATTGITNLGGKHGFIALIAVNILVRLLELFNHFLKFDIEEENEIPDKEEDENVSNNDNENSASNANNASNSNNVVNINKENGDLETSIERDKEDIHKKNIGNLDLQSNKENLQDFKLDMLAKLEKSDLNKNNSKIIVEDKNDTCNKYKEAYLIRLSKDIISKSFITDNKINI